MPTRFTISVRTLARSAILRARQHPGILAAFFVTWLAVCSAGSAGEKATGVAAADPLSAVERKIGKQPKYVAKPRYVLLALGGKADSLVWMVEDGMSIYLDRNANGDLTDDGEPLQPQKMDHLGSLPGGSRRWQCEYLTEGIGKSDGPRGTKFCLHRWNYGDPDDQFGMSLTLDVKIPMYAGWTSFWSESPEKASVIHFGGALRPRMLRYKEFVVDSGVRRLSLAFVNPGAGEGAHSRLSMYALAETVIPTVRIQWPVAKGAQPLETSYQLKERCCYWEYYNSKFKIPAAAVEGTAIVTVELPEGEFPLALETNQIEVPVRLTASPESEKE